MVDTESLEAMKDAGLELEGSQGQVLAMAVHQRV